MIKLLKPFRKMLHKISNKELIEKKVEHISFLNDAIEDNYEKIKHYKEEINRKDAIIQLSKKVKENKEQENQELHKELIATEAELRSARAKIEDLESQQAQLSERYTQQEIMANAGRVTVKHLETLVNTKPYKVWITRDNEKECNTGVELWIKEPKLSVSGGCYILKGYQDRMLWVEFPCTTFRRHNGFLPKKGELIEATMWLEVKA